MREIGIALAMIGAFAIVAGWNSEPKSGQFLGAGAILIPGGIMVGVEHSSVLPFGIILTVIGIALGVWGIISEVKKANALKMQIELTREALIVTEYNLDRGTLYVKKRSSLASNLFVIRELELDFTKYVPEKIHVGAVTVGSVTSGGVYKTGGYNQLLSTKSGKCRLVFLSWDNETMQLKEHEVKEINLSKDLVSEAINSPIKDYIEHNSIKVVDEVISPAANALMRMGRSQEAMNVYQLDKTDAYPDRRKCEAIIQWLCMDK